MATEVATEVATEEQAEALTQEAARHDEHGGHHGGHADHAAAFRSRFWLSLALTVPVVLFSPMFAELLGYSPPSFPGAELVSPVLGTAVFLYGGWPFLTGGWTGCASGRPG